MTYGTIDTKSRTLDLCQAGHPYAIYQQKGNCSKFVVDSGPPVGIITDVTYQSVRISYTPGDRLFLYSDGITECESPDGVMFGTERLSGFVDANKDLEINEIIQNLDQTICEWRQGNDFEDDISMLILEIF